MDDDSVSSANIEAFLDTSKKVPGRKKVQREDEEDSMRMDAMMTKIRETKEEFLDLLEKLSSTTAILQQNAAATAAAVSNVSAVVIKQQSEKKAAPTVTQIVAKNKKDSRRDQERKKRAEQAKHDEWRELEEEQRSLSVKQFDAGIANTKKHRTKITKKVTKKNASLGIKVKKHSIDENSGLISVMFKVHGEPDSWIKREDIWKKQNGSDYSIAWLKYVKDKSLPGEWGVRDEKINLIPDVGDQLDAPIGKQVNETNTKKRKGDKPSSTNGLECAGASGDGVLDKAGKARHKLEEAMKHKAECIGHLLDLKGIVFMQLKWENGGGFSERAVKTVMRTPIDKKVLEGTWMEYCQKEGYTDEMFCKKGISVVKLVTGHEYSICGRPVAVVEWNHGEKGQLVVHTAMEKKTDVNRMKALWTDYCTSINNQDEAFLKGHVDKNHKTVPSKKKRRRG